MKTIAMILAGGEGTRLTVLSEARAKPAVPFAGKFRIIDFTLSNCVNSGIYTVGVLTQYRPHSLNEHIGIGKPWDLDRGRGGVRLLQPYQGRNRGNSWYAGTADAIYQNLDFVQNNRADTVLILSGDHIYKMNYMPMLEQHWASGADITVGVMPVPIEETNRYGIMQVDEELRVTQFHEKPKDRDKGNLASMGIYVFSALTLEKRLSESTETSPRIDFGKDVIPAMIAAGDRVLAYRYEGYWVDVGTVDSYWATNLDLLKQEPALDLYSDHWHIHTKSEERPTAKLGPRSKVLSSMVSNGCVVRGMVVNSILSPGVYVSPGAVVKDSVVMNDTWIGPGALLDKVVVDKEVRIGAGAVVGVGDEGIVNKQMPDKLFAGITVVGKGTYIPDGAKVGRNVLINSGRDAEDFPADGVVADGQTIQLSFRAGVSLHEDHAFRRGATMTRAFAMIMAGGSSESLSVLTETRAEPAVPFGGKFRLIDFPLSNCVNSDIYNVAVLTQYRPRSLNDHIGIGKPWDLDRASGGVRLLQPYRGGQYGDWQRGTADAVRRNLDFVQGQAEENVLILAGDHIYLMDYRPMLAHHIQSAAELTVGVRRVNSYETHRYGIVSVNNDNRIVEFHEKPRRTRETLASMGIYIFRKDFLVGLLQKSDFIDFGNEVLPAMIQDQHNVAAYTFPGYWADVGTVQAYWEANMSLLAENPALDLYDREWVVHTRSEERAPSKIGPQAQVNGNLLSNGCRVDGIVERSVLSPGVYVAAGAIVRDSVILNDTVIQPGAVVDRSIIDKNVVIGAGAHIGDGDDNTPNRSMPEQINTGISLVGKGSVVPEGYMLGRNVVVHSHTGEEAYGKRKKVASGHDVGAARR